MTTFKKKFHSFYYVDRVEKCIQIIVAIYFIYHFRIFIVVGTITVLFWEHSNVTKKCCNADLVTLSNKLIIRLLKDNTLVTGVITKVNGVFWFCLVAWWTNTFLIRYIKHCYLISYINSKGNVFFRKIRNY